MNMASFTTAIYITTLRSKEPAANASQFAVTQSYFKQITLANVCFNLNTFI